MKVSIDMILEVDRDDLAPRSPLQQQVTGR